MERPLPVLDVIGPAYEVDLCWKKWKRSLEYYAEGEGLEKPTRLRSKHLHLAGIRVQDIFETLPEPPTNESSNPYETAVAMVDKYFSFKPNITFKHHAFCKLVQAEGETLSQFVTQPREQAELCQFKDAEEQIRDQLVERIDSDKLRRKLLDIDKLNLAKALEIARQYETTEASARSMATPTATGALQSASSSSVRQVFQQKRTPKKPKLTEQADCCLRCDSTSSSCPARGQECRKCGKKGHLSLVQEEPSAFFVNNEVEY